MPGPPPKPYLIKKAEGNPGKRKLNPGPQFTTGAPRAPVWMQGEARKLWNRLVPELKSKCGLSKVHGPALEGLCVNYQRAVMAEEVLTKEGMTFTTLQGHVCQRPEVSIANKAWIAVKAFCAEFGLTPAACTKIQVPEQPKKTLSELLS